MKASFVINLQEVLISDSTFPPGWFLSSISILLGCIHGVNNFFTVDHWTLACQNILPQRLPMIQLLTHVACKTLEDRLLLIKKTIMFVCLFVCFRPTREFFSQMNTSFLPVKGCKFLTCSSSEGSLACHTYCDTGQPF